MATSDTPPDVLDVDRSGDGPGPEDSLGIDHLTVVPENFDPENDTADG